MERLVDWLDGVPLGSVIAVGGLVIGIVGAVGALVALITGQITYVEFVAALATAGVGGGALSAGGGVIGQARNGAGKAVKYPE